MSPSSRCPFIRRAATRTPASRPARSKACAKPQGPKPASSLLEFPMFSLLGAPALSQFRLDKLLQSLQARNARVLAVASRLIHFVDAPEPLDEFESELLGKLLTYGPRAQLHAERGQRLLVTPRVGTVSPWSSKATDIAHVCGLQGVRRLERGTLYFIDAAAAFDGAELKALGTLLHDRMTESLWDDTQNPEGLFHSAAPRRSLELCVIPSAPINLRLPAAHSTAAVGARETPPRR